MTSLWTITGCQVTTGMQVTPTATVKMMGLDGVELCVAATGTGPVDAMYKAINQICWCQGCPQGVFFAGCDRGY